MKKLAIFALAAALAASVSAKSVSVRFDDALTNGTEWAYSSLKWTSTHGAYGFTSKDSQAVSPTFDFAITSLVVVAKASSVDADSRRLAATPLFGGAPSGDAALVRDVSPSAASMQETVSVSWDASAGVRAFRLDAPGKTGNIYLYSAEISGVPVILPPEDLRAACVRSRYVDLAWDAPANMASGEVAVARYVERGPAGTLLDACDFGLLSNSLQNAQNCLSDGVMTAYPSFSGANVYAAAESVGVVQVSSSKRRGFLVYSGPGVREGATVFLRAWKHPTDVSSAEWGLAVEWTAPGGATNSAVVALGAVRPDEPAAVRLDGVSDGATLVLRPSDAVESNRRILLDDISFVLGYEAPSAGWEQVASVAVGGWAAGVRVGGLAPDAEYRMTAKALAPDGTASEPSAPVVVRTLRTDPGVSVFIR